jgi:hypothetical protein
MFVEEVSGSIESNVEVVHAFVDESGDVGLFEVIGDPFLFSDGVGHCGISGFGVAVVFAMFSGAAVSFDGEVDGASAF